MVVIYGDYMVIIWWLYGDYMVIIWFLWPLVSPVQVQTLHNQGRYHNESLIIKDASFGSVGKMKLRGKQNQITI